MKFKCDKDSFNHAITMVQRAVSSKTTMSILSGVLISAFDNIVIIAATDLELSIEYKFTCNVIETGNTVVPARLLGEIIRKLPEPDFEFFVDEANKITIQSGKSVFNLLGMNPTDFPVFAEPKENCISALPQELLKNMILKTNYAVSQDMSKRVLTGEYLKIKPNEIEMVALDGYRVAICKVQTLACESEYEFIIPGKTMNELAKMMFDPEKTLDISTSDNEIIFVFSGMKVISRIIGGNYVNYNSFIPDTFKLEVNIDRIVFKDAVERAFLMAKEGSNLIKLSISDKIVITSNSDSGNVYEEIPLIDRSGDDLEIAFNCNYLMDALKSIDAKTLNVKFVSSEGPCLVLPEGDDNQLNLILPVRLG